MRVRKVMKAAGWGVARVEISESAESDEKLQVGELRGWKSVRARKVMKAAGWGVARVEISESAESDESCRLGSCAGGSTEARVGPRRRLVWRERGEEWVGVEEKPMGKISQTTEMVDSKWKKKDAGVVEEVGCEKVVGKFLWCGSVVDLRGNLCNILERSTMQTREMGVVCCGGVEGNGDVRLGRGDGYIHGKILVGLERGGATPMSAGQTERGCWGRRSGGSMWISARVQTTCAWGAIS